MVIGNMPFRAPTVPALRAAVLKGDFCLPSHLSLPCTRLIRKTQKQCVSSESLIFKSLVYPAERILVHTPSRRPTIDQMLASQWVNHPNLPLIDAVAAANAKQSKKSHWFSRSRSIRRTGRDRNIEMSNLAPIQCNTKRASSFFAENFLCPIDVPNEDEIIVPEAVPKQPRRSIFSGSLKKKIGPMDEMNRSRMFNRKGSSSTADIKSLDALDLKNGSCSLETKPFTDHNNPFDEEQGLFIMAPTCTDDLTNLHHMEIEARFILHKLGISSESLLRAIDSGPRSDIIGAYRIIVHRLQKQIWLNKQAEIVAKEEAARPKSNRTCAIL